MNAKLYDVKLCAHVRTCAYTVPPSSYKSLLSSVIGQYCSNLCKSIIESLAVDTVYLVQITTQLHPMTSQLPCLSVLFIHCNQINPFFYDLKSGLVADRLINPFWTVWMSDFIGQLPEIHTCNYVKMKLGAAEKLYLN